jgi:WD40 repeat protein
VTGTALGIGLCLATLPAPPAIDAAGDPLPGGARLRLGTARFAPPSSVTELALSPDGKTVVTAGGVLIAWDAATGRERWRAREPGVARLGAYYGVRAAAFGPDGRLYTPGPPGEVAAWDAATGRREAIAVRPRAGGEGFGSVDLAPDGASLALGGADGVTVCDRSGNVRFRIPGGPAPPARNNTDRLAFGSPSASARFAPDGRILAVVTADAPEVLRLCDPATGAEVRRVPLAARPVRLAFSPDGQRLAATERDNAVRLYDVGTGERLWSHAVKLDNPFENYTSAVAFSPDGRTVAAGATDNRIHLLDAATGREAGRLAGHRWYPWGLAFAPDGRTLYSAGWDGPVRRWDVAARAQLPPPGGVRGSAVVAAAPDGRALAYADDAGAVRVVGADGAERHVLRLPGASYTRLAFSPDGRRLAGGGTSGGDVHVAVWDVAGGELLRRWDWPKGRDPHAGVEEVAFGPDGRRLAAAVFRQSAAFVWDVGTGREVARLPHGHVYGLSFSPDGQAVATAGWDRAVRFWDADTGKPVRQVAIADEPGRPGDPRMYAVAYAPEGGLIATAHLDGRVRIWDADGMRPRASFQDDTRFIFGALAFSPDGLWLATGNAAGEVRVWDPRTGQRVWDRGRHQGYVYTVGFAGGGRVLASGGNDGVGYLWDLRPAGPPPEKDPAALAGDLAGGDGPAAYAALWALADLPDRAVAVLAERLRPAKPDADPARVRRLIADLDSPRFAAREAAQAELAKLGGRVAGPLGAALAETESAEQAGRLRKLLDGVAAAGRAVEAGHRRAVAVLARVGTPAARAVLAEWAAADPGGTLGGPAAAALKR